MRPRQGPDRYSMPPNFHSRRDHGQSASLLIALLIRSPPVPIWRNATHASVHRFPCKVFKRSLMTRPASDVSILLPLRGSPVAGDRRINLRFDMISWFGPSPSARFLVMDPPGFG